MTRRSARSAVGQFALLVSRGMELASTPSKVRVVAGVECGDDAAFDVVVVGELGEVHVGEVGGAVQLLCGKQAEDLGLLALAPAVDGGGCVVVGALMVHEFTVVGGAGGSLSIDWRGE